MFATPGKVVDAFPAEVTETLAGRVDVYSRVNPLMEVPFLSVAVETRVLETPLVIVPLFVPSDRVSDKAAGGQVAKYPAVELTPESVPVTAVEPGALAVIVPELSTEATAEFTTL
jgi:hypothetical protein